MQKNTVFLTLFIEKSISWVKFAKASWKQIETSEERFCVVSTPNSNMNFSRSCEKNFQKKCASIFSKVGSKESWGTTEEKVGLRQSDILKFSKKTQNFRNFFVVIWVVLCLQNMND
jgi:hypothetical protein